MQQHQLPHAPHAGVRWERPTCTAASCYLELPTLWPCCIASATSSTTMLTSVLLRNVSTVRRPSRCTRCGCCFVCCASPLAAAAAATASSDAGGEADEAA